MHYYFHHIGDFQRDTASLSDADTLAYLRLIWMYYDTELPLPNEPEKLAFKIGAASDRVAMILQNYFYFDNNAWRHKRCDKELEKVYAASQKARDKANKRWGKAAAMQQQHQEHVDLHNAFGELQDNQSNATAMLQHNNSNTAEPKNDATHKPINPIKTITSADADFGKFWEVWPSSNRKVAKAKCLEFWKRHRLSEVTDQIIAHVKTMKTSEQWVKGFEPAPMTYLNQRRWEDGLPVAANADAMPAWAPKRG
jgi:uncharacterized protein YdaU (DUF1376 family)